MQAKLNSKSGSALLLTLAIMALVSVAAMIAVNTSDTNVDLSFNFVHSDQAMYIAEAGVQRSLATMDKNKDWNAGFPSYAIGNGEFTVTVVDSTTDSTLADTIIVTSTGTAEEAKAIIEAWIIYEKIPIFNYAAYGDKGLSISQGGCTDSYNSDSGSYAATWDSLGGDIGANSGAIILTGGSTVGGDISGADGTTINMNGGSFAYGDTTTSGQTVTLDTLSDAEFAAAEAGSLAPAGFSGVLDVDYNLGGEKDLVIRKNGTLTLASGVYYFDDIKMEQGASLAIAPGAQVTIYMTGDFKAEQFTGINIAGDPADLAIFSKGSSFQLSQTTVFKGAFYGPNATFMVSQNDQLYGSIIAGFVIMDKKSCIHYDRGLASYSRGLKGAPKVIAWREL